MKEKATGSILHFLNEGKGEGAPLFTFSMKEKARGVSTLHFLNEGVGDGGSASHFLDEGTNDGVCSSFPQYLDSRLTTIERLYGEITQRDYLEMVEVVEV